MKTIKVSSWEMNEDSSYVTDVKYLGFDVTEEMLQCFPEYIKDNLDEDDVEELLHSGFWETREVKNLVLTPFYNQTVSKKDVRVEFDVEAIVELAEAPNTKFVFEFSVDRYCEGSYGEDTSTILDILEKEKDKFIDGELVSETNEKIDDLIKQLTDTLYRFEIDVDHNELDEFKQTVYHSIRSRNYNVTSDDLVTLLSDCIIYDKIDQRTMSNIENLFIDFEVDIINEWNYRIDSFTDI